MCRPMCDKIEITHEKIDGLWYLQTFNLLVIYLNFITHTDVWMWRRKDLAVVSHRAICDEIGTCDRP